MLVQRHIIAKLKKNYRRLSTATQRGGLKNKALEDRLLENIKFKEQPKTVMKKHEQNLRDLSNAISQISTFMTVWGQEKRK